jgi:hypothetical protein
MGKVISSFILLLLNISKLFIGIDSSGFKLSTALQYYMDKSKTQKKYLKLLLGAEVVYQIICDIKNKESSYKT